MAGRLGYYAHYAWNAVARRRPGPLIYGVAITDRCNLSCRGCQVANTGRPDMTWTQLDDVLLDAYARGFREVYFSGGEPTLWRDGPHTIEDAVALARGIGFFHVHLYTNGTLGLDSSADLVWVSVDGLPGTFELRRGDHFAEVEAAIRAPGHPKTAVIYVIDRNTADGIEPFLRWVRDSRLPVIGVMFYFHTPYYGRRRAVSSMRPRSARRSSTGCSRRSRAGLPVLNSRAGSARAQVRRLAAPARRSRVVADVDGESVCCRAPDECCEDCGYAACTEIVGGAAAAAERRARDGEVLVSGPGSGFSRLATRPLRRHLVGPEQRWEFVRPDPEWAPPRLERTSLYLHVPFCRNCCPYCPYTKVPYRPELVERVHASRARRGRPVGRRGRAVRGHQRLRGRRHADARPGERGVASSGAVRERFDLTGDVCIETNPADVDAETVRELHECGVALVSLGVQSFRPRAPRHHRASLPARGRRARAAPARRQRIRLGQRRHHVRAAGSERRGRPRAISTAPPSSVPTSSPPTRCSRSRTRRWASTCTSRACACPICACAASSTARSRTGAPRNGFERVSVWGFKRGGAPRYSSVTRDGYIGIGPGSGSHLPDGFVLNTFDLDDVGARARGGRLADRAAHAVRGRDGRLVVAVLALLRHAHPDGRARRGARRRRRQGAPVALGGRSTPGSRNAVNGSLELTDSGAFWLHLAQNHFALSYVNTLWTAARKTPWPEAVRI